jgi:hypothetical protein
MAFSADELRVLRRALAQVLHPAERRPAGVSGMSWATEAWTEDIPDSLRLAEAIDEAVREGGRLRAFLLADLGRYRDALPGSASGYLERLEEAVADAYLPGPEDLRALRRLSGLPCAPAERSRRSRLTGRCHALAEAAVRERLAAAAAPRHLTAVPTSNGGSIPMSTAEPHRPESGGSAQEKADQERQQQERDEQQSGRPKPGERQPGDQQPAGQPGVQRQGGQDRPKPGPRRVPTPAELFARRPRPSGRDGRHDRDRDREDLSARSGLAGLSGVGGLNGTELATGTG